MPRRRNNFDNVRFFKPHEFNAPEKMDHDFLLKLDSARAVAGIPFVVHHVRQYREGDSGDHGDGTGVDIRCSDSRSRFHIVTAALTVGFNRIGIYDKHVHVGMSDTRPPNVIWWGKSK